MWQKKCLIFTYKSHNMWQYLTEGCIQHKISIKGISDYKYIQRSILISLLWYISSHPMQEREYYVSIVTKYAGHYAPSMMRR